MRINPVTLYNSNQILFKQKKYDLEDEVVEKPNPRNNLFEVDIIGAASKNLKRHSDRRELNLSDFERISLWETYVRTRLPMPITSIGADCYRGEALLYTPKRMNELKARGVKRVIDLAGLEHYDELCKKKGLDYVAFPIFSDYQENPVFLTRDQYAEKMQEYSWGKKGFDDSDFDEKGLKFIRDFKELVNVINEGKFYICCNHGRIRTNLALLMNQYFNPKWQGDKSLVPNDEEKVLLQEFYYKLSQKDKNDLNFTQEFDDSIREKLDIPEDW